MEEARITIDAQVQLRRDTEANWSSVNPVLRDGEAAYSKDVHRLKIGDGARHWADLPYILGGSGGGGGESGESGDLDDVMRRLGIAESEIAELYAFVGAIGSGVTLASLLGGYLPLSGGTISNDYEEAPLKIATTAYEWVALRLKTKTSAIGGSLVYGGGSEWKVTDDGWNQSYALLHEGNFTNYALSKSGTAADSDKLKGKGAWEYFQRYGSIKSQSDMDALDKARCGVYQTNYYSPVEGAYNYGQLLNFHDIAGVAQIYFADFNRGVYVRYNWNGYSQDVGSWKRLAYTTDNVASTQALTHSNGTLGAEVDGSGNILAKKDIIIPNYTAYKTYDTNGGGVNLIYLDTDNKMQIFNGNVSIDAGGKIYQNGKWILGLHPDNNLYIGYESKAIGNTLLFGTQVEFYNSIGSNTMLIKDNGYVGIGRSNPSYKLDVNGQIRAVIEDSYGIIIEKSSGGYAGGGISFWYGAWHRGSIDASVLTLNPYTKGNVGVGISNPEALLDVNGTAKVRGTLTMTDTIFLANDKGIYAFAKDNSNSYHLASLGGDDIFRYGYGAKELHIRGNSIKLMYGASHTEGLVLDSNGNLEIKKNATIRGKSFLNDDLYLGSGGEGIYYSKDLRRISYHNQDTWVSNLITFEHTKVTMHQDTVFNGSIKIGDATISWDASANALKVDKNFYSPNQVSAGGRA